MDGKLLLVLLLPIVTWTFALSTTSNQTPADLEDHQFSTWENSEPEITDSYVGHTATTKETVLESISSTATNFQDHVDSTSIHETEIQANHQWADDLFSGTTDNRVSSSPDQTEKKPVEFSEDMLTTANSISTDATTIATLSATASTIIPESETHKVSSNDYEETTSYATTIVHSITEAPDHKEIPKFEPRIVHIFSEMIDGSDISMIEELFDLNVEKATYRVNSKNKDLTYYMDARLGLFSYKPYSCNFTSLTDLDKIDWVSFEPSYAIKMSGDNNRMLKVFGVAAIWLDATQSSNIKYTREKLAIRGALIDVHKWTVEKGVHLIDLYFRDETGTYFLEKIEQHLTTENIQQHITYIIQQIDYSISEPDRDRLLNAPIGYGCKTAKLEAREFQSVSPDINWIHFKLTSIRHSDLREEDFLNTEFSISVETFWSPNSQGVYLRDGTQAIKLLFDYELSVFHEVDLQSKKCRVKSIEPTQLNGLSIEMSPKSLQELFFHSTDDFHVSRVIEEKSSKVVYLEKSTENYRLVRNYKADGETHPLVLDSVTKIFFDNNQNLEKSYRFYLLDRPSSRTSLAMASAMDLSGECYQDRAAWIQLRGPFTTENSNELLDDDHFEEKYHEKMLPIVGNKFWRIPRIQVKREPTLVVRALLLDIPTLTAVYVHSPHTAISLHKVEFRESAPNLEHCAELCDLIGCTALSFCRNLNQCLMTNISVTAKDMVHLNHCDSYRLPREKVHHMQPMKLQNILSRIHFGYSQEGGDNFISGNSIYGIFIEKDPLVELDRFSTNYIDRITSAFARSLIGGRFNGVMAESNVDYDQCALACLGGQNCSSFSYCPKYRECVLADINDIGLEHNIVLKDGNCFINRKSYLTKFIRIERIGLPETNHKPIERASSPAACAQICYRGADFKCLSFDYCPSGSENELATCYFYGLNPITVSLALESESDQEVSNTNAYCDHYSRSHVADFVRAEYREFNSIESTQPEPLDGNSPEECARLCLGQPNCLVFQFCFDLFETSQQKCSLLSSAGRKNYSNLEERTVNLYKYSKNCHIFELRDVFEQIESDQTVEEVYKKTQRSSGMSVGAAFTLFLGLTFVIVLIFVGYRYAKNHSYIAIYGDHPQETIEQMEMQVRGQ